METETPAEAGDALKAALRTVGKLSVYDDPSATLRPPAALVGAPTLRAERSSEISEASFPVLVVLSGNGGTLGVFMKLVPQIVEAIESYIPNAVVQDEMVPVVFEADGQTELPAYLLTVDVSI